MSSDQPLPAGLPRLLRICLVTSDPSADTQVRELLAQLDAFHPQVTTATSCDEALDVTQRETFDLLLIDDQLDEHTGTDLLRAARKHGVTAPAILMSTDSFMVVNTGHPFIGEFSVLHRQQLTPAILDRSIRLAMSRVRPPDAAGSVDAIVQYGHRVLDALAANIAIVSASGKIVGVNQAWRQFGDDNGLQMVGHGVGSSYIEACMPAIEAGNVDARAIVNGLKDVLSGVVNTFVHEYPCHSPTKMRWYIATITRLETGDVGYAVVTHDDITTLKQAEVARQRAETRYRSLVELAPAIIFTENLEGQVTYVSPQAEAMMGYPLEAWLGDSTFRLNRTHPDDLPRVLEVMARTDATGEPFFLENRYIRPDGTVIWIRNEAILVSDGDGEPLFWQGFITDITQQKEAQADLIASEARFRALVQNVADLIGIVDREGNVLYRSPAVERTLGHRGAAHGKATFWAGVHPDDIAPVRHLLARICDQAGSSETIDFRIRHQDGSWRELTTTLTNMLDEPAVRGIVIHGRDITERARIERQRVEAESRFRTLVNQMPAMVDVEPLDAATTPAFVSPQVDELYGYSPEEWLNDPDLWLSRIHPDDVDLVREERLRTIETGERFQMEYRIITRAGDTKHIRDDASLVYDSDGQPQYWQGLKFDITTTVMTQRELDALHQQYEQIVEQARDGIVAADSSQRITFANSGFCAMVGRSLADILGQRITAFVHPDDLPAVQRYMEPRPDYLARIMRYEHRLLRADGGVRFVEVHASLRVEDGIFVGSHAILRDVTDRVAAERALRDSERRLRDVIENIPAVTYTYTVDEQRDDNTVEFSPQVLRVLGIGPEVVRNWEEWAARIHPDDRARVDAESQRTDITGEPYDITYRVRTASGDWRWVHDVAVETQPGIDGPAVWQGFFFDITKQTVLEERTNLTLRGALDAIITISTEGNVVDWNPAAANTFGYEAEDAIGRDIADLIIPDRFREAHRAGLQRIAETGEERIIGQRLEMTACCANGNELPIELSISRISSEGQPVFTAFVRDISARRAAEAAIREAEERYRTLVEQIAGAVYRHTLDPIAPTMYMSPQIFDMTGYSASEWDRDPNFGLTIVHPEDRDTLYQPAVDAMATEHAITVEYRLVCADGRIIWVRDMTERIEAAPGEGETWQGFIVDITEQKQAELLVREREARYSTLIRHLPNSAILLFDHDLRFLVADGSALDSIGMQGGVIVGRTLNEVVSPEGYERLAPNYRAALEGHGHKFEIEARGEYFLVDIAPVRGDDDSIFAGMVMAVNITERKELERQITHQALHDSLTGLPNRALLLDRLDQALARARRSGMTVAALFVDIDDFKVVNDTMGHASGDRLLQLVAERFRTCLLQEDAVTRFGGDEFVVILSDILGPEDALEAAERLLTSMQERFDLDGQELHLSCSIGVALSPAGLVDRSDLLRHADIALYRVKASGKQGIELFDHGMHEAAMVRLELERDLRGALSREEFHIVYQPIMDLATGAPVAVEALLRWTHPTRGAISPVDFIPIAEATGQIVEIGDWVIREACRQLATWRASDDCPDLLRVNVNLAARQFRQGDLATRIREALDDANLPPQYFVMELTESDVMADALDAVKRLEEMKQVGVKIAIDDFGTGYSSLAYLHEFPADVIKIDRSFVSRIGAVPDGTPIVSATIALAHTLGLSVVAEGIETVEQLAVLRTLGCDRGQGYYFSRPLSPSAIRWSNGTLLPPEARP